MDLTHRDGEILRAVNRHRFMRSNQILELLGGSRQQMLRRLQKLYHHGYLERPLCQLDYYQRGGSRTIVYGLANRGAARLRRTDATPFSQLNWPSTTSGIKRLFLEHALMISEIMVALELACRKTGCARLLTEHEIPLPEFTLRERTPFRWTVTPSKKEKIGVIPDRVFVLERNDARDRILCFLEADRGTMPVERHAHHASSIARKFQAYAATWKNGIHRTRFGVARLRVLTVTSSEERCARICSSASEVTNGRGMFLQTFLSPKFSPDTCLGAIWHSASNQLVSLLE